jgi:nicotinate-nucleotide adenylyltransferase
MSSRIRALFGGSFDPPHFGHQLLIHYLLESGLVDEVRVVPCNDHPFGKRLSPFFERVTWCEALVAPFGSRAVVDPVEAELPIPSYSFQTAEALAQRFPDDELRWVVGSDAVAHLDRWIEWHRLVAVAPLIVVGRQGHADQSEQLPLAMPRVSSSEIRKKLERGDCINGWVPKDVQAAIAKSAAND